MRKTKKYAVLSAAVVFLLFLLTALALIFGQSKSAAGIEERSDTVSTTSELTTTLVPGESYTIIFSSDENQLDASIASELRTQLRKTGQTLNMKSDVQQKEGEYELLIGNTNRNLSKELLAACKSSVQNDSLVWGFAYRDGKFAFVAATDEAFARAQDELFERFVKEDGSFVVPSDLWTIVSLSREDYNNELKAEQDKIEAEKEQQRLERINALKTAIDAFSFADFTDYVTLDFTVMTNSGSWGKPNLYPTKGEHPRLNVTKETLEYIKEYLKTAEGQLLYEGLLKDAEKEFDGVLAEATERTSGRIGYHNMNEGGLAIIETRAFLYLLTGDEEWGYRAILTMKNFLKTIDIRWIHSDQCREFGRIIFCLAEVYDWCYPLLTEDDKNQLIVAATDICASDVDPEYSGKCQSGDAQIEVGYPPSGQGSVNGHGSEAQILRDYLSVAIAIFDENPSWYEYVGARVYNDYVVTRNYFYPSGTYPQGINCYAPFRHNADIWSAWMFKCATGENPYTDELEHITVSFFEYELPDGSFFGTGDGARPLKTASDMNKNAVIIAALYGNTNLRQRVLTAWNNLESFNGGSVEMSFSSMLYYSAAYWNKTGGNDATPHHEGETPVIYHSYPFGQMIARSEWDNENAPAVFMKIGEKSTANHDHADSGSFQIFYKGLYSGESGVYDKYGSTHFWYYHQATVAHNSLLVFNPDAAVYELDGDTVDNSSNFSKSFYSGGQRGRLSGGDNLESWLNTSSLDTGTVIGSEYGLNDDGSTSYAYLAGDITQAYQATQATNVGRRMFSLFTDDEKYPMYFLVYDQITAAEESFVKKFLLHTPTEPVIDEAEKTVTLTDKDGRLVLHSLKGGDKFEALGGEGKNYLINGIQCALSTTGSDGMWGRVEISNTGAKDGDFLSFMYVTDSDNADKLAPKTIEESNLIGIQLGSELIIFTKSIDDRNTEELIFESEGEGLNRYFVTGMYAGTWHIEVDGVSVAHRVSSEDGGMISFYAPAGEVHIKPGSNIAPSNGGRIIYNAYGGIVPDSAPLVYEIGVPVTLPDAIKRGNDEFLGWYTTPTFDEGTRVTEIVGTEKGKLNVYAKFRSFPVSEDYENRDFKVLEVNKSIGTLAYQAGGKNGSCFETVKNEETGNTYLRVSHTQRDLEIYANQPIGDYLGTFSTVTFELDLAKDGDKTPIGSTLRLREQTYSKVANIISVGNDGSVKVGGKTTIFSLSEKFQKAIVTVDFADGTMTAYNLFGDELAKTTFGVPADSYASSTLEWASMLTCTFNWWIGTGGESFLVDNIKVYCGEYDADRIVLPEGEARIIYKAGIGTLPDDAPFTYKAGVPTPLPTPTLANGKFAGWYTTENFEPGTEIDVIERDTAENITVYAKYALTFFENDFTGSTVNVMNTSNTVNGISYGLTGKEDSTAKAVTDTLGNTYIEIYTNTKDATVNNYSDVVGAALSSGGKVTYTLDLATLSDSRVGWSQFRLRATTWDDILSLFVVSKDGVVYLGEEGSNVVITTLTPRLQSIAITLDIYEESITAYSPYGEVLGTQKVKAPAKTGYATVAEWISTVTNAFNWQISASGGIAFDNMLFYTGEYIAPDEVIPENSVKVNYQTLGGVFGQTPDKYVPNDAPYTLPTDISNKNLSFLGWYTSVGFEPGTEITEIPVGLSGEITVYAKWTGTIFSNDFTGSDFEYSDAADHTTDGIQYQLNEKTGTVAKTMTDASGNTYVKIYTEELDTSLNNYTSLAGKLDASGGRLTFEIDLATHEDGRSGTTIFRIRASAWSDVLEIFNTVNGTVYLGKGQTKEIATLSPTLQKICITLDVPAGTLTAYDLYGDIIATTKVVTPEGAKDGLSSWISSNKYLFNWHMSKEGGIAFDNINIYIGGYLPRTEIIPEGHTKVTFKTEGGIFANTPEPYVPTASAPYVLPTDITREGYRFDGWYNEDGELITEIPIGSTEHFKLYARWTEVIPEGHVKVNYVTGGGVFSKTPDKYAPTSESYALPTDLTNGSFTFSGWYTSSDFAKGTEISELAIGITGEITIYAKWSGTVLSEDFTGENVNVDDSASPSVKEQINFQFKGKTDSVAYSVTDNAGNTYIVVKTADSDPAVNAYQALLRGKSLIGGGKLTYTIELANVADESYINTTFRLRGTSASDTIILFTTLDGKVNLNGSKTIGTLTNELQMFAFTVDVYAGTLTAYDKYGTVLGETSISVPKASTHKTLIDWVDNTSNTFNWQFGRSGALAFDSINVYIGEYIPEPEVIPDGHIKLVYNTNGGSFSSIPDRYVPTQDSAFTLPTDITNGEAKFGGWYTDPSFKPESKITEIPKGTAENITVYAEWLTVILDYNADEVDFNLDGKEDGSLGGALAGGLSFQTKGTGSSYQTLTNEKGERYLLWNKGAGDPQIMKAGNLENEANGHKLISYTFSFAKADGKDFVDCDIKMRTPSVYDNGKGELTRAQLFICNLTRDGTLYLGKSSAEEAKVGQFGTEFKTLGVVVDFNTGMLLGYNELGEKVCECALTIPSPINDTDELYKAVTGDILDIYPPGTVETSLCIQRITIQTGNAFV